VALQFLFSCVLLGLTAYRLHYTLNVPVGDPVNNGVDFYGTSAVFSTIEQGILNTFLLDPIMPEILVASILSLFWSLHGCVQLNFPPLQALKRPLYRMFSIHKSSERTSFTVETVVLFVLWIFYLVGAAVSTVRHWLPYQSASVSNLKLHTGQMDRLKLVLDIQTMSCSDRLDGLCLGRLDLYHLFARHQHCLGCPW